MLAALYYTLLRAYRNQKGASAVEYGVMVALIAVVIITTVAILGTQLNTVFQNVSDSLGGV